MLLPPPCYYYNKLNRCNPRVSSCSISDWGYEDGTLHQGSPCSYTNSAVGSQRVKVVTFLYTGPPFNVLSDK